MSSISSRIAAVAGLALLVAAPLAAAGPANTLASPLEMAQAASVSPGAVVSAAWFIASPGSQAVDDGPAHTSANFPTHGPTFAHQSSGLGDCVDRSPQSYFCSASKGTKHVDTVHASGSDNPPFDTNILLVTYSVPNAHNHVHAEVQLCSEEFPEYSSSPYNDGAYLEWNTHSWTYAAGAGNPAAPDNFARDQNGALLTIRSAAMTAANGSPGAYDGCTCKLTIFQPVEPGMGDLYISVTDVSDGIFDTGVSYDNIKTVHRNTTPDPTCNPVLPALEFEADKLSVCATTEFTVISPEAIGGATYQWEFGDNTFGTTTKGYTTHKYKEPGNYMVKVSMYDSGTDETYEGAMDVEILKCELMADATYKLSYTEYMGYVKTQIPIYGGGEGNIGEISCAWSGATNFDNAGSCNTYIWHDVVEDFPITLTITDSETLKTATDVAIVHVMPTPPVLSEDEDKEDKEPKDKVDDKYAKQDQDGDGKPDQIDLCPNLADIGMRDLDLDGIGDNCDPDRDNDGVLDLLDNCMAVSNPGLMNTDGDAYGDACDPDDDNDGVLDFAGNDGLTVLDNCRTHANPEQGNLDTDGLGDDCDDDTDGDGVVDLEDAFPRDATRSLDANKDGIEDTEQADTLVASNPKLRDTKTGSDVGVDDKRTSPPWALALGGLGAAVVMVVIAAFLVTRKQP